MFGRSADSLRSRQALLDEPAFEFPSSILTLAIVRPANTDLFLTSGFCATLIRAPRKYVLHGHTYFFSLDSCFGALMIACDRHIINVTEVPEPQWLQE
jgi:hypothetical protein